MLTSRERVLVALNHKEPDRIPVDLGAWPETGIMADAYKNLKNHLGIEQGMVRVYDVFQQLAQPEETVLQRIGADAVFLYKEPKKWKKGELADGTPCQVPNVIDFVNRVPYSPQTLENGEKVILDKEGRVLFSMGKDGYYFDLVHRPLGGIKTTDDIEDHQWPTPDDVREEVVSNKFCHVY